MSQDSDCLITQAGSVSTVPEIRGYATLDEQIYVDNSVQPQLSQTPKKSSQYVAALSASLSAVAAGIVLGWTSPILPFLENGHYRNITINTSQMGWIGSFVTLGAMTMCIPTGFICDLIGRKRTLLLLIIPFTSGWLLIFYARNVIMLYFGRLFTGAAVGACCVAAPMYTSEISHKSIRGALGSYFQLMIVTGIFLAYLIGIYSDPYYFTLACSSFPVLFLVFFQFQPESPVYLLKRGLHDQAKSSLLRLRGSAYDVDAELNEIESMLKDISMTKVSLSQTFRQFPVRKALIITLALMFFQQFSGINTIILYNSDIFNAAHVVISANNAAVYIGAFQVIATFISSLVIDRLGRRFLLLISTSIITLSNLFLALYFTLKFRAHVDNLNDSLLTGALSVFVIVFSLGLGPIPWMISSELFTPEIKSIAGSAAGTFNWFLAFGITKFYKQTAEMAGEDSVFYGFAVLSLIGALFVYFVVPETKGKTVAEIQNALERY